MRIGIDVRRADPQTPGQQRYLWRMGAWMASRGHEVDYLSVLEQPPEVDLPEGTLLRRFDGLGADELAEAVRELGLDVLLLNPERSRHWRRVPANVLRSAYGTEQYLQKLRSFRNPLELNARKLWRAMPWIVIKRGIERAFYEDRDPPPQVIAQSWYMKSQILSSYRIPESHVHVVHNAIDPDEFDPARRRRLRDEMRAEWGIPEDRVCLLFMGHNYRLKGLWQLLERMPEIVRALGDAHLLVAGRGTGGRQRRKAERLIREYGLEGRVTLAGTVRPPIRAYAAADVFLHLSWHDSFGFVALEAMACGLPVVTTPYVGASELIVPGESGHVVDPAEPEDLLEVMRELRDPGRRAEMGRRAAEVGAGSDERSNFRAVEEVFRIAAERDGSPVGHR